MTSKDLAESWSIYETKIEVMVRPLNDCLCFRTSLHAGKYNTDGDGRQKSTELQGNRVCILISKTAELYDKGRYTDKFWLQRKR